MGIEAVGNSLESNSTKDLETIIHQGPAIARLKFAPSLLYGSATDYDSNYTYNPRSRNKRLLEEAFEDKGFKYSALYALSTQQVLDNLFRDLVLAYSESSLGNIEFAIEQRRLAKGKRSYKGTTAENQLIDTAIKASQEGKECLLRRSLTGVGATRYIDLEPGTGLVDDLIIQDTEILVIGAGPAGLLTTRSLAELGFKKVRVIDKTGRYGGIWNQKNVGGDKVSKNNPFYIYFDGIPLEAAPGPGTDVVEFLKEVASDEEFSFDSRLPSVEKAEVTTITPGDLSHKVIIKHRNGKIEEETFPIIVNTIGLGKPLSPDRPGFMITNATDTNAGIRWQQVITPNMAKQLRDKQVVIVGEGNSAAEMMVQFEKYGIDYRVVTHFSRKAVENPDSYVTNRLGREERLYRDLTIPHLTGLAGDLPDIRLAHEKALSRGRIYPDVREWYIRDGFIEIRDASRRVTYLPCDRLYTLIGYGHNPDVLRGMGLSVADEYTGAIHADYDGEIQLNPGKLGRERLAPGYFANGALLSSETNPNAAVIPGIMFRTPDLLFSVIVRAFEYELG